MCYGEYRKPEFCHNNVNECEKKMRLVGLCVHRSFSFPLKVEYGHPFSIFLSLAHKNHKRKFTFHFRLSFLNEKRKAKN